MSSPEDVDRLALIDTKQMRCATLIDTVRTRDRKKSLPAEARLIAARSRLIRYSTTRHRQSF
jgi:hypothetical protein